MVIKINPLVSPILPTFSITPQQIGLIWEVLVRNYYVLKGSATFRVSGSGPPCDIIAFSPPPNLYNLVPHRNLERSAHLESLARKHYKEKYGYLPELIPSIIDGFYRETGRLLSLQVHLMAFQSDHLRLIFTRKKTRKRSHRIWDKRLDRVANLEFIECKAVKKFDVFRFRRSKQFKEQLQYASKANALYVTVHKTDEGAERFIHSQEESISIGFIIKWDQLFKLG
jgi:hypothetical protein